MREGSDFILFVYLLVNKVPDEEKVIDMFTGSMGVKIVESQFSGHEFVGVDEDDEDDWVFFEEGVELLFGADILHDTIYYGV